MTILEFESDLATEIALCVRDARCWCPVNGLRDSYTLRVSYVPAGSLIELGWLRRLVDGFSEARITHEALTTLITETLIDLVRPERLDVVTEWAPVEGVECSVRVVAGR